MPLSQPVKVHAAPPTQQQLEERLSAGGSYLDSGHVFTTEAGTVLEPATSPAGSPARRSAGVPGSLHALRHTGLTGMALAGVPLTVVSRIAGHESISTTIDLYGHVTEQAAHEAVAAAATNLGLT